MEAYYFNISTALISLLRVLHKYKYKGSPLDVCSIYLTELNYKASKNEDGERNDVSRSYSPGIVLASCLEEQGNKGTRVTAYTMNGYAEKKRKWNGLDRYF